MECIGDDTSQTTINLAKRGFLFNNLTDLTDFAF